MKLHYHNNVEDLVAFNRYVHERMPLVKQQARMMAIFSSFLVLIFSLTFMYPSADPWDERPTWFVLLGWAFILLLSGSVAIFVYFLWKPYILRSIGKTVRKMFQHDPDKVALADRDLEITQGELIEHNEFGVFRWKVSAIERVTMTPDYVFIRVTSMRAYILPREAFGDAELDAFVDELDAAMHEPPPLAEALREESAPPADGIQRRRPV